jgi:hypothetical protein
LLIVRERRESALKLLKIVAWFEPADVSAKSPYSVAFARYCLDVNMKAPFS